MPVRTNYTLMQVWDLLGLYFACQDPYDDHIEPVPIAYGNGKPNTVQLKLYPPSARKVAFDSYPFDMRPLRVPLIFKRLPQTTYPDEKSFQEAYFRAPTEVMQFELV